MTPPVTAGAAKSSHPAPRQRVERGDTTQNGLARSSWGSSSSLTYLHLNDNELSGCVPGSLEDQLDFGYSALSDLAFC